MAQPVITDAFSQRHAWAVVDLIREIGKVLPEIGKQPATDLWTTQLRRDLQAVLVPEETETERRKQAKRAVKEGQNTQVVSRRCFPEGAALRCLWMMACPPFYRELEKKLRIVVVRRAQCMLYEHLWSLNAYWQPHQDEEWRRDRFLGYCGQQLGADYHLGGTEQSALFLAYHQEFGSKIDTVSTCLQANLFASAAERKATQYLQRTYGAAARRHGRQARRTSPTTATSSDDSDHGPAVPPANPQEDSMSPNGSGLGAESSSADEADNFEQADDDAHEDKADCASVAKYAFLEVRTRNSYSWNGDYGYQAWAWAHEEQSPEDAAAVPEDSEPESDVGTYHKALCLVELTKVLAWFDENHKYRTRSFQTLEHAEAQWGSNCRLHYRLQSVCSMLVHHPRCELGFTCVNSRYGGIAAPALCHLLQHCVGGEWVSHAEESPQYVRNAETGRKIYIWTSDDCIMTRREKEGSHYFSKNCKSIWKSLAEVTTLDCKFDSRNTICLDEARQNFDHIDNVVVAPEWSNTTWQYADFSGPLPSFVDKHEENLESFLKGLLDGIDDACEQDLRMKIEAFHDRD